MATSSSSFFNIQPCLYDVFLSFSGSDTRNTFTSHLLASLNRQGFSTFRDDTKLERGEDVHSQLLRAISDSRVSIVVFSKNYAASGWCLDELVKIMECRREFKQIVLPIFYDVNPSEVRKQNGFYAKVFKEHEDRYKGTSSMGRMARWREALTEAANLSGWDLQNVVDRDEAKLIKMIVEEVIDRLDRIYLDVVDHPVGIDSRVQQLKLMLKLGSDDVRIVSIWGIGGIGKTTIAKAIFNSIRNEFESSSFVADVSETSRTPHGVVDLQKQLLSNILMNETLNLDNYHQGIDVIKRKLFQRRVLLVLDDVDHVRQLKMLAINRDLLCKGSKIIITTKNMSSLTSLPVDSVYSPAELNDVESLKLFSLNAFKTDYPKEGYLELSKEVVTHAGGLPLALEVLGSFFSGRSKAEWESGLGKLKKYPHDDIQGKLIISFESLDKKDKELFLDIAFFFIGKDKNFTVKVLEDSECFPEIGIGELARRCLVRVGNCNRLRMHTLLIDMAKEIVRQESLKEAGERSRLGNHELGEVLHMLKVCTGTKAIEGLCLELPESNDEHVNLAAFSKMSNLRLLHLNNLCHLSGTYIIASRRLKWLYWHGFPLAYIPADLYMENLVAIDLQYSKLEQVWKGTKRLPKLRFLNLSRSCRLTKTPDFSGLHNLEELLLHDCTNLVEVHYSIGYLHKLLILDMANCKNLRKVPSSILMLKSLQHLNLSGYSKLNEQAGSKGPRSIFRQMLITKPQECAPLSAALVQSLSCLQRLYLKGCNMSYVPSGIDSLQSLKTLNLARNKFSSLPSSFSNLSSLKYLFLRRCDKLKSLPDLPKNLEFLSATSCESLESKSVGSQLGKVKLMNFRNCAKLDDNDFKRNILQLYEGPSEVSLYLPGGEVPSDFQFQGIGSGLPFTVPPHVGKKIQGWVVCAVVLNPKWYSIRHEVINKSKGITAYHPPRRAVTLDDGTTVTQRYVMNGPGNIMWLNYVRFPIDGFNLEGDDEVDLVYFCQDSNDIEVESSTIGCGISLIYEDDYKDWDHYMIF